MKPKAVFDATMRRVDRLLNLYDLLYNRRQRGTRQDWAAKFKNFMRWPSTEKIQRIDGNHALLILREESLVSLNEFRQDELSELLRSAIVSSVSALDRYCHDELLVWRLKNSLSYFSGKVRQSIMKENNETPH